MGITIKELSQISGYSSSTICRVINNSSGVKKETREKIENLLDRYHYRTNIMDLRRTMTNSKKVVIVVGNLENSFYMEQVRCLYKILRERGYNTIIVTSDSDPAEEEKYVHIVQQESYAGIIFTDISVKTQREISMETSIPMICMNRNLPFSTFDSVITDNYQGGYMATEYLIRKGHKKILYLSGRRSSYSAQERERGFRDAMFRYILPVTANSIHRGNLDIKSGYAFGEMVIKKCLDCTAVFMCNDQMGIGFMEAMSEYGGSVPGDISLICYDHSSMALSLGITTVGVSTQKLAEKTVDVLIRRLNGEIDDVQDILIRPYIEERKTVKELKD